MGTQYFPQFGNSFRFYMVVIFQEPLGLRKRDLQSSSGFLYFDKYTKKPEISGGSTSTSHGLQGEIDKKARL